MRKCPASSDNKCKVSVPALNRQDAKRRQVLNENGLLWTRTADGDEKRLKLGELGGKK
jgi:hypothetical protein